MPNYYQDENGDPLIPEVPGSIPAPDVTNPDAVPAPSPLRDRLQEMAADPRGLPQSAYDNSVSAGFNRFLANPSPNGAPIQPGPALAHEPSAPLASGASTSQPATPATAPGGASAAPGADFSYLAPKAPDEIGRAHV